MKKTLILLLPVLFGMTACGLKQEKLQNGDYFICWCNSGGSMEGYYKRADDSYFEVKDNTMIYKHYQCTDVASHPSSTFNYKCVGNEVWASNPSNSYNTYSLIAYFGEGYFYDVNPDGYGRRRFYITEKFAKSMNIRMIDN